MNLFEKLLESLAIKVETAPTSYGPLHIVMIIAVISTTVFLCKILTNRDERLVRKVLFSVWCIMVIGEIYHQLCFSFDVTETGMEWDYPWYKFPFQFCSSPLYTLPFVVFLPDGKVRDGFIAFLASFSLFAGLAVMIYPNDVFTRIIGVSVQTMIHHGMQVVLGIFLGVRYRKKANPKYFLGGVFVFSAILMIALIMNVAGYHLLLSNGMDDTFNMFYISPYFNCTLPILSDIYLAVPYPIFLAIYIFGFAAVAAFVFFIQRVFMNLFCKLTKTKENFGKKNEENCLIN